MKKIYFIFLICSFIFLSGCSVLNVSGKKFVYDSWKFKEGQDLSDVDEEGLDEFENQLKTINIEFTDEELFIYIEEELSTTLNYKQNKNEIKIEGSNRYNFYIKDKKLYWEAEQDSFQIIVIFKVK